MEFLLISSSQDPKLFTLNALTNSLLSFFKQKKPLISLVLTSDSPIDDNFLFLGDRYKKVDYVSSTSQLKKISDAEYDFLISIENSLLSLVLSHKIKARSKICFKGKFTFFVFDKIIPQIKKEGIKYISLQDIGNLMDLNFKCPEAITPKYHLENSLVRKNHEMIHWIYNTNHSIDLPNSNYILIDIKINGFQKNKQLEILCSLCSQLVNKFKLKIIFISDQQNRFENVLNTSASLTPENFIYSQQSIDEAIAHFPLLNHSSLIVTNKLKSTPFLDLINKPFYLIKNKGLFLKFYSPTNYYKNLSKKIAGEISYMLKSI